MNEEAVKILDESSWITAKLQIYVKLLTQDLKGVIIKNPPVRPTKEQQAIDSEALVKYEKLADKWESDDIRARIILYAHINATDLYLWDGQNLSARDIWEALNVRYKENVHTTFQRNRHTVRRAKIADSDDIETIITTIRQISNAVDAINRIDDASSPSESKNYGKYGDGTKIGIVLEALRTV